MTKLQIGIDLNEANVKTRVGTGQYCNHVLIHWYKNTNIDFHLYHRDPLVADLPKRDSHWHYHQVGPSKAWLRFGLPLSLLLAGRRHDVFWSPAHYMPPFTLCPSVVTIHDLAYEYFPELFLPSDLYKLKNWTRAAVRQATHIIAVSSATKEDLIKLYHVKASKISVVYNGYDSSIFTLSSQVNSPILTNWQLKSGKYLLFLGTIQPRKNLITLVNAFELLKREGYLGKLVLAGNLGWLADETLAVIKHSSFRDDIILTGYIRDEVRVALYQHADVFILPSLYEGFGVPVLEAMACGTPVAASNNSSLPEVVGEAGVLFEATSPKSMATAIKKLQSNRSKYIKLGLNQATKFSWGDCAQKTLEIILQTIS